eukprot:14049173-Alexandrium_andersonii.AAC.1
MWASAVALAQLARPSVSVLFREPRYCGALAVAEWAATRSRPPLWSALLPKARICTPWRDHGQ